MASPRCKLSREELMDLLRNFYEKNGRSPKLKELTQANGFPSRRVYHRVFETTAWSEVLEKVGLPIHRVTKDKYSKEDLKRILVEYYNNTKKSSNMF